MIHFIVLKTPQIFSNQFNPKFLARHLLLQNLHFQSIEPSVEIHVFLYLSQFISPMLNHSKKRFTTPHHQRETQKPNVLRDFFEHKISLTLSPFKKKDGINVDYFERGGGNGFDLEAIVRCLEDSTCAFWRVRLAIQWWCFCCGLMFERNLLRV